MPSPGSPANRWAKLGIIAHTILATFRRSGSATLAARAWSVRLLVGASSRRHIQHTQAAAEGTTALEDGYPLS